MIISVYSDGSGNTFDSDGGYGWRMLVDGVFHSEGSGYAAKATNNTMECEAAIVGLEAAKSYIIANNVIGAEVTLISDSQLVLGYASGKWKCKALHLTPLYIKLRKLHDELKVVTKWERGHQGEVNNERCDELAKVARESKGLSNA